MEEGADKRTANDEYNAFTVMLYKEVTIDERKKILMTCEVERKFIESNDIADDTKFILKLEEKNIISESNVGPLLKCVEALDLNRLAGIVRSYQSKITTESTNEVAEEKEITPREGCGHADDEGKLLCVTCGISVCYECAFTGHEDHEVLSEEEFDDNIKKSRLLLDDGVKEVYRMIESFEQELIEREKRSSIDEMKSDIAIIAMKFQDSIESQFENTKVKLSNLRKAREESLTKTKTDLKHLSLLITQIEESTESKSNIPDLNFLQKINQFEEQISGGLKRAENISENLKDVDINVRFCPSSLSARFVNITVGPIIGSIRINENQAVIVTDQRHFDQPAIRLSCVSCDNTAHVDWSHVIESEYFLGFGKKLPQIALCNIMLILPSKICILIGCGNQIFQVEILEPKDACFYDSFTVRDIKLPEGSQIACLSVILSRLLPAGVVVTDSISQSIARFDRDLVHVETIELEEKPHIATAIHHDTLTYAYSNGRVVKIIDGTSPNHIIRTLENPQHDQLLYPADMFHDFTDFIILWKSKGSVEEKEKLYKIMAYRENGASARLSCEGTYSTRNEAIGISFVKNHGLLCLSNGKFVLYDTL
ncbi:uncharacterized protein [Apostichopus japonicus]|uniref:uncharacterized protein isoform X3 n=1 Tax=Stichopus japonicus TaxID=307972 RepID=UPI003AB7E204